MTRVYHAYDSNGSYVESWVGNEEDWPSYSNEKGFTEGTIPVFSFEPNYPDWYTAMPVIIGMITQITDALTEFVPEALINSWPKKAEIAHKIVAETATQEEIDFIQREADENSENVDDLINLIIANDSVYSPLTSSFEGLRRKARTDLQAATSSQERQDVIDSVALRIQQLLVEVGIAPAPDSNS